MPADDLGAPAYRKFDIEVWMPSRNSYGEVCICVCMCVRARACVWAGVRVTSYSVPSTDTFFPDFQY